MRAKHSCDNVFDVDFGSFIAIGDSFTEGLGDLDDTGTERGWADLLARCLAERLDDPSSFTYANLAIRGRKLGPLIEEQLPPALDQRPELLSICGGGNDAMRPSVHIDELSELMRQAVVAARERGAFVLALSGADPTEHLPLGPVMRTRAAALTHACEQWAKGMLDGYPKMSGVTR